jgi:phospholipase C
MPFPLDKIKHLVVLMMENRSFDHMLGRMMRPGYPIDGLTGNESNPDSTEQEVRVTFDARTGGDLTPDPGHHFPDVNLQIFGNVQAKADGGPLMKGFVQSYQTHTHSVASSRRIMKCFSPDKIPALSGLAWQYAICDRWFSSVPGPTLPNRSFIHSATSIGRVDMSPLWLGEAETIYERLAKFGVSAKIYYHDWSMAMTFKNLLQGQSKFFGLFDDFNRACKKGTLPNYSLIEPRYYDSEQGDSVFEASDQHPDHSVSAGDRLIKNVYTAIRENQQVWESTLLVITYDEHGGLYDHVTPPATVNPDGKIAKDTGENVAPDIPPFDFTRLGIRVPAVVVSPYIERCTIDHTLYDHTSIIATARKLFLGAGWETNFLTERDRTANTFDRVLNRTTPRTDTPNLSAPQSLETLALMKTNSLNKPLSVHQRALVEQAYQLEQSLPPNRRSGKTPADIKTERDASRYLAQVTAELTGVDSSAAGVNQ